MASLAHRNRRTGAVMGLVGAAMVGLGFASVPLYRIFCQATGFNGTPARAAADAALPSQVIGKVVTVRFDSNVSPHLPWSFRPEKPLQRTAIGARQMAFFVATNNSDHTITGSAAFNVTPEQSAPYFVKIQCFCFTQQTLKPGETVRMPVIFYVDPKFLDDPDTKNISEITLSYTFFPVDSAASKS
jgi:cytochrome c oxidase assembly protein subunit 11